MHQVFRSKFFNFEFLRILSTAPFGGADIAECFQAAGEIKDLDPVSWENAWHNQAQQAEAIAKSAMLTGDDFSARRAYMRASNYYRASGYMLNDRPETPEPRVAAISDKVSATFLKGARLLPGDVSTHEIPYDGVHPMPAYLYLPPTQHRLPDRKTPILINTGGADSIQEELYYIYGSTGPELGYAVLTFEGPGQGTMLRRHGLRMRPDWEYVVGKVLNHLEKLATEHPAWNLDLDRIALAGASMGGYYALRGASDPRIKACVAIDPFYDMWDFATAHISPALIGGWQRGYVPTPLLDGLIAAGSAVNFQMRWEVDLARWFFGVKTPTDTLLEMQKYTLKLEGVPEESFLKFVKCPVLVSGASESLYLEPERDVNAVLQGLKHLPEHQKRAWIANTPEGGALQAKIGAIGLSAQRTFQFLDEHFDVQRDIPHMSLLSS